MIKSIFRKLKTKKLSKSFFFSCLLIMSQLSFTTLLLNRDIKPIYFVSFLGISAILYIFLLFKYKMYQTKSYQSSMSIKLIMGIVSGFIVCHYFNTYLPYSQPKDMVSLKYFLTFIISLLSYYFLYKSLLFIFNKAKPFIKKVYNDFTGKEKKFIIWSSLIVLISLFILYTYTNVFYRPLRSTGEVNIMDILYTSDSPLLLIENSFVNIDSLENDIRQPLFGVVSLVFSILPYGASKLISINFVYPLILAYMNYFMLAISAILLAKLISKDKLTKCFFVILFLLSYPTIFFTIAVEQYVIGMFFLVLFLYSYIKKYNYYELPFIASCGCLITNFVLTPLLIKGKKLKSNLINILNIFFDFIAIFFICGKSKILIGLISNLKILSGFTNVALSMKIKLLQYFEFVKNCFVATKGVTVVKDGIVSYWPFYPTHFNAIGIIILLVAILGFILNRKDKLAKICLYWIAFSFVLLGVIGYGSVENGMILYTLYFSWAFLILIYKFILSIFEHIPKLKNCLLIVIVCSMLLINSVTIFDIIKFGNVNYKTAWRLEDKVENN